MNNITVTFPSGKTLTVPKGTTAMDIIDNFSIPKEKLYAVIINNELSSLPSSLSYNSVLQPVVQGDKNSAIVYRRSLCFILAAAAHTQFPDAQLLVGNSIGYGYYYTLNTGSKIDQSHIDALKKEMQSIIQQDLPIHTSQLSYADACRLFEDMQLDQTRRQLDCICPPYVIINTVENDKASFSDMYFGPLLPSSGYIKAYDLIPYGEGFLLRFPDSKHPDKLTEFADIPPLFEIYKKYKAWGTQVGVTSAADLNMLVKQRKVNEFIDITETFQVKCIADIADQIYSRPQTKVVLLAGPSSSGKTTTSKKLALQLKALGYRPKVISLDNFYVGRDRNPKDENGNYDYECLEALDVPLLNRLLVDMFDGKEVELPSYDFVKGEQYFDGTKMKLEEHDILIMEGIHGLNDRLTPLVKPEYKFKIYLSALTQLNLDNHNRISTSDNRLIRRIVRDSKFRGKSAAATISMWESVRKGERLHIFPFQVNADAMLNTALDYELSVLKVYAEPLLRCVSPLQPEYTEAARLLRFLNNFSPIPPTDVPDRSIIREFIGGSAFHY